MRNFSDNTREQELASRLRSLEVQPPDDLWAGIEHTLRKRAKKRILAIVTYASAAVLALLVAIGSYRLYPPVNPGDAANTRVAGGQEKPGRLIGSQSAGNATPISHPLIGSELAHSTKTTSPRLTGNNANTTVSGKNSTPYDFTPQAIPLMLGKELTPINAEIRPITLTFLAQPAMPMLAANHERPKPKAEWTVTASGFPVYAFHTGGVINPVSEFHEMGLWTWGGAVTLRRSLRYGFSVETGLCYNPFGQSIRDVYLLTGISGGYYLSNSSSIPSSFGTPLIIAAKSTRMDNVALGIIPASNFNPTNLNLDRARITQLLSYIEVPVTISRQFRWRQLAVNLRAGLTASLLVQNRMVIECATETYEGITEGVRSYIASATLAFGVSYPVTPKARLFIEPTLRLGLSPLASSAAKSYPFSTAVRLGVEVPIGR